MQNILVTGASSGIGEATVVRLAARGMRVFAGVRDPQDGDALPSGSQAGSTGSIQPLVFDVRDLASVRAALTQVAEVAGDEGLTGLVNNAGDGFPGPWRLSSSTSCASSSRSTSSARWP